MDIYTDSFQAVSTFSAESFNALEYVNSRLNTNNKNEITGNDKPPSISDDYTKAQDTLAQLVLVQRDLEDKLSSTVDGLVKEFSKVSVDVEILNNQVVSVSDSLECLHGPVARISAQSKTQVAHQQEKVSDENDYTNDALSALIKLDTITKRFEATIKYLREEYKVSKQIDA